MKFLVIICMLFGGAVMSQTPVYNVSIRNAKGEIIRLADYKGKKILIAAISRENLDKKGAFNYLDSLQKSNREVAFIIVPINDFGEDTSAVVNPEIVSAAPQDINLASAAQAKKDKGSRQDPLMRWLTNVSENSHFDFDVTSDNQVYVISESGELYAVLEKGVSDDLMNEVLRREDRQK